MSLTTLLRCCGPAGAPSELNDAYEIEGVVYIPVGLHRGALQTWQCIENLETGERKDYCTFNFEAALEVGEIEVVPALEVLALIQARGH